MTSRRRWIMSGPWPHPDSGIFYFRKETPADLKRQKGRLLELGVEYRSSIHRSLETRDPKEAKMAYSGVLLEVEAMWQGWRDLIAAAGEPLTHGEKATLIREMMTSLIARNEEDPGSTPTPPTLSLSSPSLPDFAKSKNSDSAMARADAEQIRNYKRFVSFLRTAEADQGTKLALDALRLSKPGSLLEATLRDISPQYLNELANRLEAGMEQASKETGRPLSRHQKKALAYDAFGLETETRKALESAASFDYRPLEDLKSRLHAMPKAAKKGKQRKEGVSIPALYELWKRDHEAGDKAKKTAEDYRAKVEHFIKWLGHDDAQRVTKGDLWEYCDRLRHEEGLSAKTIQGKYLTCIKAIFRKGFERDFLKDNVAASVRYTVPKKVSTRSKGYTDEEARSILAIADASLLPPADGSRERRSLHNRMTGRWVPWLCCYTGARVAEITQLRKEDILQEHGIWCLKITPEAGSVKTGQYRLVPLHPHLVEIGFLKFVEAQPEGPLFYDAKAKRTGKSKTAPQEAADSLARWIKGKLGEAMPKVQPNHAWRHRFKTLGREAGLGDRYLDAIQGHSDGSAAAGYGETTVKALYREICKIPYIS